MMPCYVWYVDRLVAYVFSRVNEVPNGNASRRAEAPIPEAINIYTHYI